MKNIHPILEHHTFKVGELYLFHPTDPSCPPDESLWGVCDMMEEGVIYLESSSFDLRIFRDKHHLPAEYRHARLASRDELRDYMYNLGCHEVEQHHSRCGGCHNNYRSVVLGFTW